MKYGGKVMTELKSLPNIGQELETKLKSIGITSIEELKSEGSKTVFLKLKNKYANVCLVHLYCLQGAIDSVAYNNLPDDIKKDLKKYSDSLKEIVKPY